MTVKRFFGESAREALRKVKAVLGPEAIVISNKSVPGGVEIVAMSADSLAVLSAQHGSAPAAVAAPDKAPAKAPAAPPPAPAQQDRKPARAAPHSTLPPTPSTGGFAPFPAPPSLR